MKRKIIFYTVTLIIGIIIGWLFFHSPHKTGVKQEQIAVVGKVSIWTCAMHPQIRMEKPGKCPICGMDLIPLVQNNASVDPGAIVLTKEAAALANVHTSVVGKQKPIKEVRLYGKVQADERLLQSQVAQFPGRIEKLLVNFTGEVIRKGQTLASIYSPELVTAQQEFLEAVSTKFSQPGIYEASKEKLRQWKITGKQIENIETNGSILKNLDIVATSTGIVMAKRVNVGDFVAQGTTLYDIADLSEVWVLFDAYESDLPFLADGDKLTYTVEALPGINYSGKITFIDPFIDPVTRVSKIRVEINNRAGKLKPGMFAIGVVDANLSGYKDNFIVPRSSVLWTGKRSIVYVKQAGSDEPIFKIREVGLGPLLGNNYVITDGLSEGEEIVTQGTFSVDAAAQLEGKPSMMNPQGGKTNTMPGMDMSVNDKTKNEESMPRIDMSGDTKSKSSANSKQMIQHATFSVSGNCELCKERIETAAKSIKGVTYALWEVETKKINVEFNSMETSPDAIQKAIANAGHDTDKFKAGDATYNSLPGCCKYRK